MKQGSQNRLKFTLSNMKKEFKSMVEKYIPEFPKQVDLKLPNLKSSFPKLKKVDDGNSKPPTLPKLKRVENNESTVKI